MTAPVGTPRVRIALLDSGADLGHPGLRGRVRVIAAASVDDAGTITDEPPGRDQLGHGTAVAATIVAHEPHAEFVVLRVFRGEPRCTPTALAAALQHVTELGVDFVNCSLGLASIDARARIDAATAAVLRSGARLLAPATAHGLPCLPGSCAGVDAVLVDGNVDRRTPQQRRHGERMFWFASPQPPPGLPGLPPFRIAGDSLAVANVTGWLAAQASGRRDQ